jgi:hypothetical protein
MSKIPLPERGQPLDLSYIYQIAETVNELASQLSPTTGRYTSIDTVSAGTQSVRTSDSRIVGGYFTVPNTSTTSPDGEGTFNYSFTNAFAYAPIVTATPVLIGDTATDSGKNVTVVLTQVTTSGVAGVVRFNTIGVANVGINILAVGIPV